MSSIYETPSETLALVSETLCQQIQKFRDMDIYRRTNYIMEDVVIKCADELIKRAIINAWLVS